MNFHINLSILKLQQMPYVYEQFVDSESSGFIGYIVFNNLLRDTFETNEAEKIDWKLYTDI